MLRIPGPAALVAAAPAAPAASLGTRLDALADDVVVRIVAVGMPDERTEEDLRGTRILARRGRFAATPATAVQAGLALPAGHSA